MAITNPYLTQRFRTLIWYCIDNELYKSAVFYAERFFYVDQYNHEARHLFATALLRCGQTHSALHLVSLPKDIKCNGCTEINSKCCSLLGRHREARVLMEICLNTLPQSQQLRDDVREARAFPEEAVMHCRSGIFAAKANMRDKAIESFTKALSLNPLLWEAFDGLCSLGSFPEIDVVLRSPIPIGKLPPVVSLSDDVPYFQSNEKKSTQPISTGAGFFTPEMMHTGANGTIASRTWKPEFGHPHVQPFRLDVGNHESTTFESSSFFGDMSTATGFGAAPIRTTMIQPLSMRDEAPPANKRPRAAPSQNSRQGPSAVLASDPLRAPKKPTRAGGAVADLNPTRRSTRLLNSSGKQSQIKHPPHRPTRKSGRTRSQSAGSEFDEDPRVAEVPYSPTPSSAQSPPSEASPAPSDNWDAAASAAQEAREYEAADKYIFDLMKMFARVVQLLAQFRCSEAVTELEELPEEHRSPSALVMLGRAHYKMGEYTIAERAFKEARKSDPYRIWDMEIYSTLLWHLKQNVQLSFLAQELVSIDPKAPEAWIAVGNCFSLQKEHPQAMTCFRRAAQLDPRCAYAYTLSGHESLVADDLDAAITFFQTAIKADSRHYNAWYGLGSSYQRMSKFRAAEFHYRKAAEIHPCNGVLYGCLGTVMERRGQRLEALKMYDYAAEVQPDNALVRYRRAKILVVLKRYDEAVKELVQLRDLAPREANIVFLLGKVYRLMGDKARSAQQLTIARDFEPKIASKIKKLIEGGIREEADGTNVDMEDVDEG